MKRSAAFLDGRVKLICRQAHECPYSSYPDDNAVKDHSLRQLYIEYIVSQFLEEKKNMYQITVAISLEIMLPFPLSRHDITRLMRNGSFVMTSDNNNAGGYTDGLYVGPTHLVAKVMDRFKASYYEPPPRDYEMQVLWAFQRNNISHAFLDRGSATTAQSMAKLRHNGGHRGFAPPQSVELCLRCPLQRRHLRSHGWYVLLALLSSLGFCVGIGLWQRRGMARKQGSSNGGC